MEMGKFSVSLSVKDIEKSKVFYETIGFKIFAGDQSQNWLIMTNGDNAIGLFQGMLEANILTFNPGWDKDCNTLEDFADIRKLHKNFKSEGIDIINETMTNDTGPSSFSITDPDGNTILIDQHV